MRTELISNKLTKYAEDSDKFGQGDLGDLIVRNWSSLLQEPAKSQILILDLDLTIDGIPSDLDFTSLRAIWSGLREVIPSFLNSGGVLIILASEPVSLGQFSTNVWIDDLQVGELIFGGQRQNITFYDRFPALTEYFECVDSTNLGIRVNESIVQNPTILAKHSFDNETVSISLDEFPWVESQSKSPGRVVVLPQPTNPQQDVFNILHSLMGIGEYYHEIAKYEVEHTSSPDPFVDMEYILKRGETERVEYKAALPNHVENIAKELAALANSKGGVLALGVRDDGTVTGLDKIHQTEERVSTLVRNKVQPRLYPRIEKIQHDGKDVLLIRIYEENELRCVDGKFYIRVGTTRDKMDWKEIRERAG